MEFKDLPKARRQKIMDAAMEEFAAHDYRGANTETIAARGGISKGLLFYYFKNKKSLYPIIGFVAHFQCICHRIQNAYCFLIFSVFLIRVAFSSHCDIVCPWNIYYLRFIFHHIKFFIFFFKIKCHNYLHKF